MTFFVTNPGSGFAAVGGDSTTEAAVSRRLHELDGSSPLALIVGPTPAGRTPESMTLPDMREILQAGGSADRLSLQVSGVDADDPDELFTIGRAAPDESENPGERIVNGPGWTQVYPQELWDADSAARVMAHYVDNDGALPEGLHLRRWLDRFGIDTGIVGR